MVHTIQVIDDSTVMRASVAFVLKPAGFGIAEAKDGQAGLDQLNLLCVANQRPALILVDINMPVMDGISFIKHVKQGPHKFIPILVLTTESEDKKKLAGKDAGAAGWLVKPFKEDQLLAVIRKFIK